MGEASRRPRAALRRAPGTSALAAALLFQVLAHAQWVLRKDVTWTSTLTHFDSNWFVDLIEHGRGVPTDVASLSRWAFLPGMLELTRAVAAVTTLPVVWSGALLSTVCAFAAVRLLERNPSAALPTPTTVGWLLFVLSPASSLFFTFHTEGLFLLASVVALIALERRPWLSLIAVAVCVVTRNQGVFVVAWLVLLALAQRRHRLALALSACGLAALLALAAWSYAGTGALWSHYRAQANWPHADGLKGIIATFWFGNESQIVGVHWVPRHVFAIAWLVLGLAWVVRGPKRATALYVLASAGVLWLQGNLQNAFRFASVCFPAYFYAGEYVSRRPRWLQAAMLVLFAALHVWVVRTWLRDGWPY